MILSFGPDAEFRARVAQPLDRRHEAIVVGLGLRIDRDLGRIGPAREVAIGSGRRAASTEIDLVGHERRDRMHQPHERVEHVGEHLRARRALRRRLRRFQIPIAERVPAELHERIGGHAHLEAIVRARHRFDRRVQLGEDPLVGERERHPAPASRVVSGKPSSSEAMKRSAFQSLLLKRRASSHFSSSKRSSCDSSRI